MAALSHKQLMHRVLQASIGMHSFSYLAMPRQTIAQLRKRVSSENRLPILDDCIKESLKERQCDKRVHPEKDEPLSSQIEDPWLDLSESPSAHQNHKVAPNKTNCSQGSVSSKGCDDYDRSVFNLEPNHSPRIDLNFVAYIDNRLLAQREIYNYRLDKAIEELHSETKEFIEIKNSKIQKSLGNDIQLLQSYADSLKSNSRSFHERLCKVESSLTHAASLKSIREIDRSIHKSLDKSHAELADKYDRLRSDVEVASDRLESLYSILENPESRRYFDILLKASQRTFFTRIAYKIPPLRILLLGAFASSGFFLTQLMLNLFLPLRVDPYHTRSVSLPRGLSVPLQRVKHLVLDRFVIDPQLSTQIIQEKYPEFGAH